MLSILTKYFVRRSYKKLNNLLDKQAGKPETPEDWKVRSMTCESILNNKKTTDEFVRTALKMIKEESEIMAELSDSKIIEDYLSQFAHEKEIDKYIQTSGKYFAKEFWFYKDKSRISLINDNKKEDYHVSAFNPGRFYERTSGDITYNISLNNESPEKVMMTVESEDDLESFIIELEKMP